MIVDMSRGRFITDHEPENLPHRRRRRRGLTPSPSLILLDVHQDAIIAPDAMAGSGKTGANR